MKEFPQLSVDSFMTNPNEVQAQLDKDGFAIVDMEHPVTMEEMLGIATHLGSPVKETTPLALANADSTGSILRISSVREATSRHTEHVFSVSDMGMHIDHALAPQRTQPDYIALGCEVPPVRGNGGQTLAVDSGTILENLSPESINILGRAHQRIIDGKVMIPGVSPDPVLRRKHDGSRYLSLWDAGEYGEVWNLETHELTDQVAMRGIVEQIRNVAMQNAQAIPWVVGRVAIWDNKRFLHARTAQIHPSERSILRAKIVSDTPR